MVVKIKTGKIYGLQPPLVATVGFFFFVFFFFGYMVDCLRPFLKIACLQLPIQVFKEEKDWAIKKINKKITDFVQRKHDKAV